MPSVKLPECSANNLHYFKGTSGFFTHNVQRNQLDHMLLKKRKLSCKKKTKNNLWS